MHVYKVLTIAGSDSGGGAGIQADIKTITALGGYATSVITALTAQNTLGVHSIFEIPAQFVGQQIDAIMTDIGTDAVKIGMLANKEIVEIVCSKIMEYNIKHVVVDPAMLSKNEKGFYLPMQLMNSLQNCFHFPTSSRPISRRQNACVV